MKILRQLGANSAIYTATNLLQRGTAFLLLPLYTLYLDPSAYGVLAIITAVNGLLSVVFTLGLTSAMTRFYFEYQHDPDTLAEFWGSILVFILLLSTALGSLLLLTGNVLLRPLIGNVPFWPFVALGVMATFFQPFFTAFLAVLQMRNQAGRYATVSLAHFALTTVLTIAFVVFFGWGVSGPLVATLIAAGVFFVASLLLLRDDLRLTLQWRHVRPALGYSLPLVPHSISGQATAFADRLVLNSYLGTAAAGLYSVGAMVALVIEVGAQSVNRAYVPLTMAALKRGAPDDIQQIRSIGTLVVAVFCLLGTGVAAFGSDLLHLMASSAFAGASSVIPLLVFAAVANAMYLLFVNVLFYERSAVKLIPVGTLTAAFASVLLSLTLVPRFGLIGAATSTLLAQIVSAVVIAALGRRLDPVQWNYGRYALAFLVSLGAALALDAIKLGSVGANLAGKLAGLSSVALFLGFVLWNRPLILGRACISLLRSRPDEAAALFTAAKASA